MIGVLELTEGKGRKPAVAQERLLGLRCVRAAVPIPARMGEGRVRRRVEKGARALELAGARRVLTRPDFPYWEELRKNGLRPVEVEGFCQALAASLALAELGRRQIPPTRAAVTLSGPRVSRALLRAAEVLCPQVRCLTVDVPGEGERVASWLWKEYGAAVFSGGDGRRAHVALCFGPGEARGETVFSLYGPRRTWRASRPSYRRRPGRPGGWTGCPCCRCSGRRGGWTRKKSSFLPPSSRLLT